MKNIKDYTTAEFLDMLLSKLKTDNSSEKVCEDEDARCTDGSEDNEYRWGECSEVTYSYREYDKLKEECNEKDYKIQKLKRTIEILEYFIYNYIIKGDRRKD